uniref:Putative membrane protein n=1 Tax=Rhizobium rhizogenes TaxID=359 RepID=A0A7S5DQW9_RHIRH|nr:putative membrane protein [Rhizobium rhizogenes]
MMNDVMGDGMMWGMGLAAILGLVVVGLLIAALIKYLFYR